MIYTINYTVYGLKIGRFIEKRLKNLILILALKKASCLPTCLYWFYLYTWLHCWRFYEVRLLGPETTGSCYRLFSKSGVKTAFVTDHRSRYNLVNTGLIEMK